MENFFIKHNNKTYNCRVSTIPVVKGEKNSNKNTL